jgi:glycosyltransferase involved in cell wall biosynthesis
LSIAVWVIPCFNEERRLDQGRVAAFANDPRVSLVLVDDGSRDGTRAVLEQVSAAAPGKVTVLGLPENRGKGEAVRAGLLHALERGAEVVGYADADLSTPPEELFRLQDELQAGDGLELVLASRVLMVGRRIERKATRHYLGRVFATFAANILRTGFYDTQCGAKLMRDTEALRSALATPFISRWAFDVELLGRLLAGDRGVPGVPVERIREVPIEEWIDKPGSKVDFRGMSASLVDLGRIEVDLRARRKRGGRRGQSRE